jgi:ankyrin repeat protein
MPVIGVAFALQAPALCPSCKPPRGATSLRWSNYWWGRTRTLACSADDFGWPSLMWAVGDAHARIVRLLLDKGAAINQRSVSGGTALFFACCGNDLLVVRLLVDRGADVTIARVDGSTPLMGASEGGHLEVVRLLLGHPSAKVTIDHRDERGETALWRACFTGRAEVVRVLLESGADPTIATNDGTTHGHRQAAEPSSHLGYRRGPPGVRGSAEGELVFFPPPNPRRSGG